MGKLSRENLLSHINDTDDIFEMKKIIDKIEIVIRNHFIVSTDFLNPHEINLAISILNRISDVNYSIYGGYEDSELKIITIFPEYMVNIYESDIAIFNFNSLENIKHKDILGSILGLGVDRRKIGDILVDKKFTYFFVKKEISNFILFNLNNISRYNIDLKLVNEIKNLPIKEYDSKEYILSSLRLDNFISTILNISRSKSQILINREKVKVNFKTENKSSFELSEGDIISIRQFGRFIFYKILGTTKKGNFIIIVNKPK